MGEHPSPDKTRSLLPYRLMYLPSISANLALLPYRLGTDKLTIFAPENGYSVLRTTQTGIAVGVVVELWGNTRRSEWRRPTPAN